MENTDSLFWKRLFMMLFVRPKCRLKKKIFRVNFSFLFFLYILGLNFPFTPEQPKTTKDFVLGSYVSVFLCVYVYVCVWQVVNISVEYVYTKESAAARSKGFTSVFVLQKCWFLSGSYF